MVRSSVNAKATADALNKIAKQIPFAASRTVNGLALQAQAKLRQEMDQRFTLRRPGFIKGSGWPHHNGGSGQTAPIGALSEDPDSLIDVVVETSEEGCERALLISFMIAGKGASRTLDLDMVGADGLGVVLRGRFDRQHHAAV